MELNAQKAVLAMIELIKEVNLREKIDVLEKIYDALMKEKYYELAACFAKKHGL